MLWLFILLAFIPRAYAADIDDHEAIRVIVSEAADQGYKGMVCVGEVIRHRGSIKGFYGYSHNHADTQPRKIWKLAAKAWATSARTDYTKGADHFENIHRFGNPRWFEHCIRTYEYRDHVFCKEVRKRHRYVITNG